MDEVKPAARLPTVEHREPCESRGSRTVLGAPGGEIPPGDSSEPVIIETSFDNRVRAAEQRDREGEAERLSGLEIDHELDLRGLRSYASGHRRRYSAPHASRAVLSRFKSSALASSPKAVLIPRYSAYVLFNGPPT